VSLSDVLDIEDDLEDVTGCREWSSWESESWWERVVRARPTVPSGGSRREDNCWGGAPGDLVSLVGREVADMFSTRHPGGPVVGKHLSLFTLHSISTGVSKHHLTVGN
jgi:hypothetical protein